MKFGSVAVAIASSLLVSAAPTPVDVEQRADSSVTPITAATISSYASYVNFAAATYCSGTANWSCTACKRVPGFVPYATGGDGDGGMSVGGHQAPRSSLRMRERTQLSYANALFGPLDSTLFPGVPSNVQVHSGFRNAQASTASAVLAAVKKVIADKGATKVTTVGHSLGGAIAALDALFLKKNLPSTISIKAVTYGQPRVGNQDFANLIDTEIADFSRITNLEDDIPIVPGRGLGYHHFSGEKHIKSTGVWNACAGQDNTSTDCSTGAVENIFVGNVVDHLGPYEGVWIGTIYC
ncbi:Lipase [Rhizoctonia solani]|uniref:Lipase n=1 Tax=Rhizoctonia solani TaxID=456999 RepID=A0A0K6G6L7_9AGAM|nr:Lipase [Rhizoctonia solani]